MNQADCQALFAIVAKKQRKKAARRRLWSGFRRLAKGNVLMWYKNPVVDRLDQSSELVFFQLRRACSRR
jgi:hypothetical protein